MIFSKIWENNAALLQFLARFCSPKLTFFATKLVLISHHFHTGTYVFSHFYRIFESHFLTKNSRISSLKVVEFCQSYRIMHNPYKAYNESNLIFFRTENLDTNFEAKWRYFSQFFENINFWLPLPYLVTYTYEWK